MHINKEIEEMNTTLEEAQSALWKELVEAKKPELYTMQEDLLNKVGERQ
tara:strand:- start:293 stop:439 length:147 start_codon:yes stop_codon:yes gene_type:complete